MGAGEFFYKEKRRKLEGNFVFVFKGLEFEVRTVARLESNNCRR
jgi:hypothetical protein